MADEQPPKGAVREFRPHPGTLEKRVHELARHSHNVWFKEHADDREDDREIDDDMVFEVLRTGQLRGSIEPGKYAGEWKCKMVKRMKGTREVGVITIVVKDKRLWIKTVEWEDVR